MRGRRRDYALEIFSVSFVDCIASFIGAVITLVLILAVVGRGQSQFAQEHALWLDVEVRPAPDRTTSPDGRPEDPPPSKVAFWLSHEDVWRQEERLVAASSIRGGAWSEPLTRGPDPYLESAHPFDNAEQGHATLWLEGVRSGRWLFVVTVETRRGGRYAVDVRSQVGKGSIALLSTTVELPPGGRRLSFKNDFDQARDVRGDALVVEVP